MNGNDQDYQISWETDRCSVRVDMEGDIRFADDDRGIESMDRAARRTLPKPRGSERCFH